MLDRPSGLTMWEGTMLYKKLFQMVVVGGALIGTVSGCVTTSAASDPAGAKKPPASTPSPEGMGGGVPGW
jgi:hypothetical protein